MNEKELIRIPIAYQDKDIPSCVFNRRVYPGSKLCRVTHVGKDTRRSLTTMNEKELIRIPIAYQDKDIPSCVFNRRVYPGSKLCRVTHVGVELAFESARLIYPHAAIQFLDTESWSTESEDDTRSALSLLRLGEAEMSIPGMALSEERFNQNRNYWPITPQRITIAYAHSAFPTYKFQSSYTGLFPLNSSLICLMVALIYNGVLLGRARGGDGPLARFFFHQRNFLVASLFYGIILKLLRSNLIISFNRQPERNIPFTSRDDVISALETQSVTGLTTQSVYIDTLLKPLPKYHNYSAEYVRLARAARSNEPLLLRSTDEAVWKMKEGASRGRRYIIVGSETLFMDITQSYCGIGFTFFDVSPPNSEGLFYGKKLKKKVRLSQEYATVINSIKDRLNKRYAKKCPGVPRWVKGRLRFQGVQSIFSILMGIYGVGVVVLGVEWGLRRSHFWVVWMPEERPPPIVGPDSFFGFRPLPRRRSYIFSHLPNTLL